MKRALVATLFLALAMLACILDFNPPPLSLTPPAAQPSSPPVVVLATPTLTPIPATAYVPVPTETLVPATQTMPAATATSASPTLTLDQLRNASLTILGSDQILRDITLKDGKYEEGTDPAQPGYVLIHLGQKIAFGDLNGDGLEDAAVTMVENFGGTGEFVSVVAILNQAGQPKPAANALIDDRPILNELAIQNGEIFVDAIVHGPNDPMCCAALPKTGYYRLIENSLILSRLTSKTSEGSERSIQIEAPADGSEISGPFLIKGSVSISPFENNLTYTIFPLDTNEPSGQAGFTINGDGLGGPGTFELPLDLTIGGYKGPVRIEISDVSPADGSYLAIDTLYVLLK